MPDINVQDEQALKLFELVKAPVRGRFVRLNDVSNKIIGFRDYPPVIRKILGEALTLTAGLASMIKYDGIFTLQISGDGLMPTLVCDMTSHEIEHKNDDGGGLRGYVRYEDVIPANANLKDLVGKAYLAFTVHKGSAKEPYQGIVPLEKETLSECIEDYFTHSEQIPTHVIIHHNNGVAAALIIQRIPEKETDPDAWNRACVLADSVTAEEMLNLEESPETLLYKLFHEEEVALHETRPLRVSCRCTPEKFERVLSSVDEKQLNEMAQDGKVSINCEFCNYAYEVEV